jgi:WD40 repeat protein
MANNLIETTLSTKQLSFKPGGSPAFFEVTVVNHSDRFASFQVEAIAAGVDSEPTATWYKISPEVSTKKPPGDSTTFKIGIVDSPVPGWVGLMNVTVRVFSIELLDEDREIVRLAIEQGTGSIPLQLKLPVRDFHVYPDNQIEIPVRIYNPAQIPSKAIVRCLGLEPSWLGQSVERQVQVLPGKEAETTFLCQPPFGAKAPSQVYPFTVEASHSLGPPSRIEGSLEVLAVGNLEFRALALKQRVPQRRAWAIDWRSDPVTYLLECENASNLAQEVTVDVTGDGVERCDRLELEPDTMTLYAAETGQFELLARAKRPLLGWKRRLTFEANALVPEGRLNVRNELQILQLDLLPIVPRWLQLFLLFLWLLGLGSLWYFMPRLHHHKAPVHAVEINGLANFVVSGSNDETIRTWQLKNRRELDFRGVLGSFGKAVRTLHYRPVDNNLLAVGLENGEIQLWDLLSSPDENPIDSFSFQKDDRVLALAFTRDGRYLFSGHGSGSVLQWEVQSQLEAQFGGTPPSQQPRRQPFDFAISGLALVGTGDRTLAVAGRFNQLRLWNWSDGSEPRAIAYPETGGQNDYIFAIEAAEYNPYLLVTADSQGSITIWNLQTCLSENQPCDRIVDRWSDGHDSQPVRALSLSRNGCYLATGGDDGKLKLWPLTADGRRADAYLEGIELATSFGRQKFNAIDLKIANNNLLIVGGSDDLWVHLRRHPRLPQVRCEK